MVLFHPPRLDRPIQIVARVSSRSSRYTAWSIAALLIWQVFTVLAWRLIGPTDFVETVASVGPYHGTAGVLTLVGALARTGWTLRARRRRPPSAAGTSGRAARFVHAAFYVLMIAVQRILPRADSGALTMREGDRPGCAE